GTRGALEFAPQHQAQRVHGCGDRPCSAAAFAGSGENKLMPQTALVCLLTVNTRLMALSRTDLLIILLYFVLVLGLGVYLRRFATTSNEFFMAGREMTAWIAGLSFISAN